MSKSSNLVFSTVLIALFPLTTFACGISLGVLGSFFNLFIYLVISFTFLYSFTFTLRKYFAFIKNNLPTSEVLTHSKNISKLYLLLIVFSLCFWTITQIVTSGFCLNSISPSEQYSNWIIQLAYVSTFLVSSLTYIVSKKLINKIFITPKLCFYILLLTFIIELIPLVAFLRLTVFFPETIPERFKGDYHYQQINESLKDQRRVGDSQQSVLR